MIPQRSERRVSLLMILIPNECQERKVREAAPWGPRGGEASALEGLPWGIDTFHSLIEVIALIPISRKLISSMLIIKVKPEGIHLRMSSSPAWKPKIF